MNYKLELGCVAEFTLGGDAPRFLWAPLKPEDLWDDCLRILDERTRALADELRAREPELCKHGTNIDHECKACEE